MLFDLETVRSPDEVGGWANAHRMRVALGVVCHLQEGRFEVFGEDVGDSIHVEILEEELKLANQKLGLSREVVEEAGVESVDQAKVVGVSVRTSACA